MIWNRAAVDGLIEHLSPKVSLIDKKGRIGNWGEVIAGAEEQAFLKTVSDTSVWARSGDRNRRPVDGCLPADGLDDRITGLILDLRYSQGQDYAAAVALADRFFSKAEPLLDWGEGVKKSSAKTNALDLPLVIL